MFPNPKPAVDAVDKLGPLPSFLFSNPVFAGFFAMIMLPVFGASATIFFSLNGEGPREIFEMARSGAMLATAFGVLIFFGILISAFFMPDERTPRLLFVLGGVLGLVVLVAMDALFADGVRAYLAGGGSLFRT